LIHLIKRIGPFWNNLTLPGGSQNTRFGTARRRLHVPGVNTDAPSPEIHRAGSRGQYQ
jgi:hypothetical protein